MFAFDVPDNWPLWLFIIIQMIVLFRKEIGVFVPDALQDFFQDRAAGLSSNREHRQSLEKKELSAKIKREDSYQENLAGLLHKYHYLLEHLIDTDMEKVDRRQTALLEEMRGQRRALLRLADIIAVIYSEVRGHNGETLLEISREVEELMVAKVKSEE